MRLSLNNEQWQHLCCCSDTISDFPATVGTFIQYFTERKDLGNFNIAHDPISQKFGVWYSDELKKFEAKELIDAMFNLFCHLEGV